MPACFVTPLYELCERFFQCLWRPANPQLEVKGVHWALNIVESCKWKTILKTEFIRGRNSLGSIPPVRTRWLSTLSEQRMTKTQFQPWWVDLSEGGVQILSNTTAPLVKSLFNLNLVPETPLPDLHPYQVQKVWSCTEGIYVKTGFEVP